MARVRVSVQCTFDFVELVEFDLVASLDGLTLQSGVRGPDQSWLEMGKNPKFRVHVQFWFLHILFTFGFRFCSVLGKTWVLVRFVIAGFRFFPISSLNVDIANTWHETGTWSNYHLIIINCRVSCVQSFGSFTIIACEQHRCRRHIFLPLKR